MLFMEKWLKIKLITLINLLGNKVLVKNRKTIKKKVKFFE